LQTIVGPQGMNPKFIELGAVCILKEYIIHLIFLKYIKLLNFQSGQPHRPLPLISFPTIRRFTSFGRRADDVIQISAASRLTNYFLGDLTNYRLEGRQCR